MTGSGGPPHNAAGSAPPQTTPAVLNRIDGAPDGTCDDFAARGDQAADVAAADARAAAVQPDDFADILFTSGATLPRGPNVMLGYLDDREATTATVDTGGWLHTGDIGIEDTGRQSAYHRPAQGHVHLWRIQRLPRRDRAGSGPAARGGRGRGDRCTRRAARGGRQGVRGARSVEFIEILPRNPGGKVVKPQLRERA